MMKHIYIFLPAFMILSLTGSCKKSVNEIEKKHLMTAIDEAKVSHDFRWIVILPGLGCHGCIQEAEIFMKDNINNTEILFVLTKISSLKILQQKIGVQIREYSNVYVDLKNEFVIPTDNSIYPCIIQLKDGRMVAHEFQSPQNGAAFRKLKELLLAQ
jgi:hypothetical protein